jgi:hypothetical protein
MTDTEKDKAVEQGWFPCIGGEFTKIIGQQQISVNSASAALAYDRSMDRYPDDDEPPEPEDVSTNCGRWDNGRLGKWCVLAGTEFCDWDCPYSI